MPGASLIDVTAVGAAGSASPITCTPPSDATTAYAAPPIDAVATPLAPSSMSNAPWPSSAIDATDGEPGSVTLITCTPLDSGAATTAYVPPPTAITSTELAPPSASNVLLAGSMPPSGNGCLSSPTESILPSISLASGYEYEPRSASLYTSRT